MKTVIFDQNIVNFTGITAAWPMAGNNATCKSSPQGEPRVDNTKGQT